MTREQFRLIGEQAELAINEEIDASIVEGACWRCGLYICDGDCDEDLEIDDEDE